MRPVNPLHLARRLDVRFCDRCGSISTGAQRAAAHRDRTRDAVLQHGPRA